MVHTNSEEVTTADWPYGFRDPTLKRDDNSSVKFAAAAISLGALKCGHSVNPSPSMFSFFPSSSRWTYLGDLGLQLVSLVLL